MCPGHSDARTTGGKCRNIRIRYKLLWKGVSMIAVLTHQRFADRHRMRHANARIRWKRDRHWLISGIVGLVLIALISFFMRLASLSMP